MKVVSTVLALAVSLVVVGGVMAADKSAGREGKRAGGDVFQRMDKMVKGLNLTDQQKTQYAALKTEYAPKVKEATQALDSVLTPEQKTARQEAVKAGKAAGKSRKEVWKDAQAAVKLTDEQKTKLDEARKAAQALRKEIREKVMAILTPEQKAQLKAERKERREKRSENQSKNSSENK